MPIVTQIPIRDVSGNWTKAPGSQQYFQLLDDPVDASDDLFTFCSTRISGRKVRLGIEPFPDDFGGSDLITFRIRAIAGQKNTGDTHDLIARLYIQGVATTDVTLTISTSGWAVYEFSDPSWIVARGEQVEIEFESVLLWAGPPSVLLRIFVTAVHIVTDYHLAYIPVATPSGAWSALSSPTGVWTPLGDASGAWSKI